MDNAKLTVIVDNIGTDELKGEWGLSILCEYGDKRILADVGGSDLFATNMKALGFAPADVDYATLSHAHFDHANGMPKFFEENSKAKFYLRDTVKPNCYKKILCFQKYIGIPKNVMADYSDRIELVSGDYQICDGVYLIPHKTPGLEAIGKREGMYQKQGLKRCPDDFSHEQSLVLDTPKGLVIINCCSHGGTENIINEVKETFPEKRIYGLIGGFHLFNKSEDFVRKIAKNLAKEGLELVCTGHCTGERAFKIMKEELGDAALQLKVGLQINI